MVAKTGVAPSLPSLPSNGFLVKNEESHNWLLTKLVNAERASYQAPGFATAMQRTREQLLMQIMTQFNVGTSSSGWG